MKRRVSSAATPRTANGQGGKKLFVSRSADLSGAKVHYTIGGSGPTVILLHGFAETSRMWNPILPALGEKFTVIAPDLAGIGDSSIPSSGMGMKAAAIQLHDLARSLGITNARVVGHDIGLMVNWRSECVGGDHLITSVVCGNNMKPVLAVFSSYLAVSASQARQKHGPIAEKQFRPVGVIS